MACAHDVVSQQCDDNRDAIRLFQGVRFRTVRPMLQKYDCDFDPGERISCIIIAFRTHTLKVVNNIGFALIYIYIYIQGVPKKERHFKHTYKI